MDSQPPPAATSIHFQRRWFYALWIALLAVSLVTLALWHIPGRRGRASLTLALTLKKMPEGTRVLVWSGSAQNWKGRGWAGEGAKFDQVPPSSKLRFEAIPIDLAYRRWLKTYIQGKTADLIVVKTIPAQGLPRYIFLSLQDEIMTGEIHPGGRTYFDVDCNWASLPTKENP